jgi:hypothetical protein
MGKKWLNAAVLAAIEARTDLKTKKGRQEGECAIGK